MTGDMHCDHMLYTDLHLHHMFSSCMRLNYACNFNLRLQNNRLSVASSVGATLVAAFAVV